MKNNKRKVLYLNKTILMIVMIGYSAFLVLMLLMDFYLIRKYKTDNMREEQRVMNEYIENLSEGMYRIDRQLYNIYENDENFQALRKKEEKVKEYGNAYELKETLIKRMMTEESMDGFFIFYDNFEKTWYKMNSTEIRIDECNTIKEQLKNNLKQEGKMRSWFTVAVDEDIYLSLFYKKDRVALYGIISLRDIENEIQEKMGKNRNVVISDMGMILKNKELVEK